MTDDNLAYLGYLGHPDLERQACWDARMWQRRQRWLQRTRMDRWEQQCERNDRWETTSPAPWDAKLD